MAVCNSIMFTGFKYFLGLLFGFFEVPAGDYIARYVRVPPIFERSSGSSNFPISAAFHFRFRGCLFKLINLETQYGESFELGSFPGAWI